MKIAVVAANGRVAGKVITEAVIERVIFNVFKDEDKKYYEEQLL